MVGRRARPPRKVDAGAHEVENREVGLSSVPSSPFYRKAISVLPTLRCTPTPYDDPRLRLIGIGHRWPVLADLEDSVLGARTVDADAGRQGNARMRGRSRRGDIPGQEAGRGALAVREGGGTQV